MSDECAQTCGQDVSKSEDTRGMVWYQPWLIGWFPAIDVYTTEKA